MIANQPSIVDEEVNHEGQINLTDLKTMFKVMQSCMSLVEIFVGAN